MGIQQVQKSGLGVVGWILGLKLGLPLGRAPGHHPIRGVEQGVVLAQQLVGQARAGLDPRVVVSCLGSH